MPELLKFGLFLSMSIIEENVLTMETLRNYYFSHGQTTDRTTNQKLQNEGSRTFAETIREEIPVLSFEGLEDGDRILCVHGSHARETREADSGSPDRGKIKCRIL